MRKATIFSLSLFVLLLALSLVQMQTAVAGGPAAVQHTDVAWHMQSGAGPVEGAWGRLVRNDSGATFTFHARDLMPGHVYTIWFVVVNNPAACASSPCTPADVILNSEAVESDVIYGAGHVAGQSGNGTFGGHLPADDWSGSWFGNGFANPRGAEIHLVLNDHGPMIPDLVSNMLSTYRGGCTDESLPPIFPATAFADGIPGPNTCRLYQTAIFLP
jgi:hypothetical protein